MVVNNRVDNQQITTSRDFIIIRLFPTSTEHQIGPF